MKNLLVLTPRFPYPLHGGDLNRIYRLCEALAKTNRLTLLSFCQTKAELERAMPADAPFAAVHRIHLPKWKSYLGAATALLSGQSLQIGYYANREFANAVTRLTVDQDAVLCHLIRTAPYAVNFPGVKILEMTDHIPLTYARSNALKGGQLSLRRLIYTFEKARVERAIRRITKHFDFMTFVSDVDRTAFLAEGGVAPERVGTFGLGVELGERPFIEAREGFRIAFIGTLKSMPNADAVSHFVTSILPIIQRSVPQASLKIVGPVDSDFAQTYGRPDVVFTGAVPDLAEATRDCVLGICPVRFGAGMQTKMLDYMALGLAAVTSSVGEEGIRGANGDVFLVADAPEAFAAAAVTLLQDDARRGGMARRARALILEHYSWEQTLRDLPAFVGL